MESEKKRFKIKFLYKLIGAFGIIGILMVAILIAWDQLEMTGVTFLWISGIIIVLGFIFSLVLADSLSHRIELLMGGVVRISEGNRSEAIPIKGSDELSSLTAAFNVMQENVQSREKSLQDLHAQLEQRVAYHTRELAKANEELKREIQHRRATEEKKKSLKSQLRQALKMEAIGTLAGGIAHDFNNILGIIVGYTDLAILDLPETNPAYLNLIEVRKGCTRARDLVKQILSFSRQSEQELKPVKLSTIIKETFKLLRSTIPSTIEIHQEILNKPDTDTVLADPTQIHQLIINLCTNAAHAMREHGGRLDIALKDVWLDEEEVLKYQDLKAGPYLKLSISDTGDGIKPEILDRIFDPYFTTKEKEEGTGMGLAVVLGIVKNHHGAITVESQLGQGTTFDVLFPIIQHAVKIGAPEFIEQLQKGSGHILLVDDEETIVKMVTKMLLRLGYEVTSKLSSVQALECFRETPQAFDAVITDMTMPNLTGDKLAEEILNIRPGMPIILCTGFSEKISEERAKAIGIKKYLLKPVVMEELSRLLKDIL